MEEREHECAIAHWVTELVEGAGHRFQAVAKVGDVHGTLLDGAELGREEKGTRLPLAKELVFENRPGDVGVGVAKHHRLLEIADDGALGPREDSAVHVHPRRVVGIVDIGVDVIRQRILAEEEEEEVAPSGVVVGSALQHDGDEDFDIDDSKGLGVDSRILRLERVESSRSIGSGLGFTLTLLTRQALGLFRPWKGQRLDRSDGGARGRTSGAIGGRAGKEEPCSCTGGGGAVSRGSLATAVSGAISESEIGSRLIP